MDRRIATIDVGTNTTLLLVARATPAIEVLEERAEITRLGRGIGTGGELAAEGIARTLAVLRDYADLARRQRADIAAIGTEALRRARNARRLPGAGGRDPGDTDPGHRRRARGGADLPRGAVVVRRRGQWPAGGRRHRRRLHRDRRRGRRPRRQRDQHRHRLRAPDRRLRSQRPGDAPTISPPPGAQSAKRWRRYAFPPGR